MVNEPQATAARGGEPALRWLRPPQVTRDMSSGRPPSLPPDPHRPPGSTSVCLGTGFASELSDRADSDRADTDQAAVLLASLGEPGVYGEWPTGRVVLRGQSQACLTHSCSLLSLCTPTGRTGTRGGRKLWPHRPLVARRTAGAKPRESWEVSQFRGSDFPNVRSLAQRSPALGQRSPCF